MTRRQRAGAMVLAAVLAAPPAATSAGSAAGRPQTATPSTADRQAAAEAAQDDDARRVLREVLSDRRFRRARDASWQTALMERVRRWLLKLADLAQPALGRGNLGQFVAWAASIGAVAVLLVWLMRFALRRRVDAPLNVAASREPPPPGHVLAMQAAGLIGAGRLREGARAAYGAALRRLEEEGTIRPDPARTPRETLRVLTPSHRVAAPMTALTSAFERIWYGGRPAAADDGPRLLALLRELKCLPFNRAN